MKSWDWKLVVREPEGREPQLRSLQFEGTPSIPLIFIVIRWVKLLPSLLSICSFDLPGPLPHGLLLCFKGSHLLRNAGTPSLWGVQMAAGEEWSPLQSSQLPCAFPTELWWYTPPGLISQAAPFRAALTWFEVSPVWPHLKHCIFFPEQGMTLGCSYYRMWDPGWVPHGASRGWAWVIIILVTLAAMTGSSI